MPSGNSLASWDGAAIVLIGGILRVRDNSDAGGMSAVEEG